jgi:predicted kinase
MGLPGAGKSTLAGELVGRGYARLNRDEAGGRLSDLLPALETRLAAGERRVVLDNTYGSRAARNAVIEAAWRHGVPVRCVWLQTSVEEAGVNVVSRMLARYGRLLDSDDLARAARRDPGLFAPGVLFRHRREQEPPEASEGFTRVEAVAFERRRPAGYDGRALIFWYEGVVRASRRGLRAPSSPDDVEIVAAGRDLVHRYAAEGWPVVGLAWHPEVARGERTAADVEATFARTHELLGLEIEHEWCPHGSGPPVCWCRKPIPGLGVVLVERHRLDPARCLYFGTDTTDEMFARTMGFTYRPEFTCRRVK